MVKEIYFNDTMNALITFGCPASELPSCVQGIPHLMSLVVGAAFLLPQKWKIPDTWFPNRPALPLGSARQTGTLWWQWR